MKMRDNNGKCREELTRREKSICAESESYEKRKLYIFHKNSILFILPDLICLFPIRISLFFCSSLLSFTSLPTRTLVVIFAACLDTKYGSRYWVKYNNNYRYCSCCILLNCGN